jgi:AP-1-like transcription factor
MSTVAPLFATMDYSYFTPGQQQYPYLGLPPTPAHTSANSDEYSNSPSVCAPSPLYQSQSISYPSYSHSQSQSLSRSHSLSHSHFVAQSPRSPAPNPVYPFALTATQDDFNNYQTYDYNQYAPSAVPQAKPPTPQHKPSITATNGFDMSLHVSSEEMQRGSNSDEDEKDMTPAQSRRKAQNRAA